MGARPHPPTLAPLEAYLDHLRRHGVPFVVDDAFCAHPDHCGAADEAPDDSRDFVVPGLPPVVERRRGTIRSDHATVSMAMEMARRGLIAPGSTFWDIGTGSGMLALSACSLGARHVLATDIDPDALALASANAAAAGAVIRVYAGSLLTAVPQRERAPDIVAANLPHKPAPARGVLPLSEDGGDEGDALLRPFFAQAAACMARGSRLVLFQHSLPHPRNLRELGAHFRLSLSAWKRRFLAVGENGELATSFAERARAGTSYLATDESGRSFLVACVWIATRR